MQSVPFDHPDRRAADAAPPLVGFYVSVLDPSDNAGGGRKALALGPFLEHEHALDCVPMVRRFLQERNPWAAFWAFGTCRLEVRAGGVLPEGKVNGNMEG